MKKFLVIGDPIEHSLSPKLHNYWFKQYNVDAVYEKKRINEAELKDIVPVITFQTILPFAAIILLKASSPVWGGFSAYSF